MIASGCAKARWPHFLHLPVDNPVAGTHIQSTGTIDGKGQHMKRQLRVAHVAWTRGESSHGGAARYVIRR